jgi:hypothetical protein
MDGSDSSYLALFIGLLVSNTATAAGENFAAGDNWLECVRKAAAGSTFAFIVFAFMQNLTGYWL